MFSAPVVASDFWKNGCFMEGKESCMECNFWGFASAFAHIVIHLAVMLAELACRFHVISSASDGSFTKNKGLDVQEFVLLVGDQSSR